MRNHYGEDAIIDLICLAKSQPAAQLISGLNHCHVIERGTGEILNDLKTREYHYLLDVHGTVRSRSLAKGLGIMTLTIDKQWFQRWSLIRGLRREAVTHHVDRSLALLKPFGIPTADPDTHAWGTLNLKEDLPEEVRAFGGRFAVVGLGSSQRGKHLSNQVIESAMNACRERSWKVVLVGGQDVVERAASWSTDDGNVIDGTGSWSLGQVAKCIQAAQALISGDTATMHLGAAVNTPTLSVWGCTKPGLGLHAWHPHEASRNILPLRNGTHDHRPCSKHGASCRFTSSNDSMHPSRCSQAVDAQEVANWVLALPG